MLKIRIVSPRRVAWEGEAAEIQVPGLAGEFGVLPDHARMLAATRAGVVVMNTPLGNTVTTGELAISLMCSLSRHIPRADRLTRSGTWKK